MKAKTLETLTEGMVVKGTIKNITEYGAFVDLGGIDGLLHITDMSWGRVNHPSEVFQVGDEVTVKVLKYNAETERVSLGLKQTQEDPWNHAEEAYPAGKKVRGKVMSITDYGAFVELEPGVEGLIHVSEMSWTKKVKHPSKLLEVGQEIECQVLEVDARAKRISLGLKQLEPDPWMLFTDKYHPGDKIGGKVRSPHRLRRLRRHRRGRRRHGPQERSLVVRAGQQPERPLPQGRRRRGHHPLDQPRREEGLPRHQAAVGRPVAEHAHRVPPGRVIDDARS
jgi:ribosomal protein S1